MIPPWFFKGMIATLYLMMVNFIVCEANNDGLNLSHTSKDEKAFQMVKERIQDVLKQEEIKMHQHSSNDEGPRKFYYKKYMKLGKARDDSGDYGNTENRQLSRYYFRKSKENEVSSEKKSEDFQELSPIANREKNILDQPINKNVQGDRWHTRTESTNSPGRININDIYPKELNTSPYLKNEGNFPKKTIHQQTDDELNRFQINENYKLINNYMDQMKLKKEKLDKQIPEEKNKITNRNHILRLIASDHKKPNSSTNLILRTPKSFKILHYKKKRKCYRPDKINENKKLYESNDLQLKDHRRVRSCDIKMEDLRESFIPNEQLSIYHPKMSLSDQFILQDTMF